MGNKSNNFRQINISQFNPYVRFVVKHENDTASEHKVPWRILYDFEIIFVSKGRLTVFTENKVYDICENCFHIMPPFVKHTRRIAEGITCSYFSVHLDFMYDELSEDFSAVDIYQKPCECKLDESDIDEGLAKRNVYQPEVLDTFESFQIHNSARFYDLFDKLNREYHSENTSSTLRIKAYMILIISEFIAEIQGLEGGDSPSDNIVSKFMDYTAMHYAEFMDLDELVKEYGVSPSRFRSIFKQKTNKAPHAYLINYRIEQAKTLLKSGKYSVSEVSYMVGYDDVHYFSKLFKSKEKVSPKDFINKK